MKNVKVLAKRSYDKYDDTGVIYTIEKDTVTNTLHDLKSFNIFENIFLTTLVGREIINLFTLTNNTLKIQCYYASTRVTTYTSIIP